MGLSRCPGEDGHGERIDGDGAGVAAVDVYDDDNGDCNGDGDGDNDGGGDGSQARTRQDPSILGWIAARTPIRSINPKHFLHGCREKASFFPLLVGSRLKIHQMPTVMVELLSSDCWWQEMEKLPIATTNTSFHPVHNIGWEPLEELAEAVWDSDAPLRRIANCPQWSILLKSINGRLPSGQTGDSRGRE